MNKNNLLNEERVTEGNWHKTKNLDTVKMWDNQTVDRLVRQS